MAEGHAAVRATQYYPEVRAWHRSKKRRKPDVVARALVAKEIARSAYHVFPKQEAFNGRFKGVLLSRVKQARTTRRPQWPLLPSPTSITGTGGRDRTSKSGRPPSAGMGGE